MATKHIARYIDAVQAVFPFDGMGHGHFVRYEICTKSKMVMVTITLPVTKSIGDHLSLHQDCIVMGKRFYLCSTFIADDIWAVKSQALSELNRLRNLRDQTQITLLNMDIIHRNEYY